VSSLAQWGVAIALVTSCGDGSALQLCGEIPKDGCPIGRGGTCDDVYCAALYDCVEGDWTRVEDCPLFEPPTDTSTGTDTDTNCTPMQIDHSKEVSGCTPDLLEPDCPAAAAEQCGSGACLTGCSDFFLCQSSGWVDVAFCDENGDLFLLQ